MNIKQISLFSLIFITIAGLNNTIIGMGLDDIKKNIKTEMHKLDEKIINLQPNIDLEEAQIEKFNEEIKKEIEEKQKELELKKTNPSLDTFDLQLNITKLKYSQKRNQVREKYLHDRMQYILFAHDLQRCERFNNLDCFKFLEKEILEWNKNN